MVHIQIPPGGSSRLDRWLSRAVVGGVVLVELAACAWIIYKIISPKY